MAEHPIFWVGNQNPSITQTILNDDGSAHDLTGQTVKFKMRALRSATLKVNAAAAIVNSPGADGKVRYDWQAADVDTAAEYLCWWEVTTTAGGKTQDVSESVIEFRAHSLAVPNAYVELEQLKETLELKGQVFADADLMMAANAASRGIDSATGRRFYLDTDASQVRYYTPESLRLLPIDDLAVLTSVAVDRGGSGSFTETWVNGTDFVLEPFNAPADYRPFETLRVRQLAGRWLPTWIEKSVQVTGQFGWTVLPEDIKAATAILAAKLFKRAREAPFGIVTVGIDQGAAMRIAKSDPDVYALIHDYSRHTPLI